MKFCLLFNLSPCAWYCLLIGSQLTTWSQGNLHYIRLHFFQLDREFFCLLPSLARFYTAAASPSEQRRSDGSFAIILDALQLFSHLTKRIFPGTFSLLAHGYNFLFHCSVISQLIEVNVFLNSFKSYVLTVF